MIRVRAHVLTRAYQLVCVFSSTRTRTRLNLRLVFVFDQTQGTTAGLHSYCSTRHFLVPYELRRLGKRFKLYTLPVIPPLYTYRSSTHHYGTAAVS